MIPATTLTPDYQFNSTLEALGPFNTSSCFQCQKCSNGCPVAFTMEQKPDEIIKLVILGQKEMVIHSETIWMCASCETCSTRCPNGVRISPLMDCLKEIAIAEGVLAPHHQSRTFHQTFLKNIKRWGRIFEGVLIPEYAYKSTKFRKKWKELHIYDDSKLALRLFIKGRLSLFPKRIKDRKKIRKFLNRSYR